jgi:hypothetical protein
VLSLLDFEFAAQRLGKGPEAMAKFSASVCQLLMGFHDVLFEPKCPCTIDIFLQLLPSRLHVGGCCVIDDAKQPLCSNLRQHLPKLRRRTDETKCLLMAAIELVLELEQRSQKRAVAIRAVAEIDLDSSHAASESLLCKLAHGGAVVARDLSHNQKTEFVCFPASEHHAVERSHCPPLGRRTKTANKTGRSSELHFIARISDLRSGQQCQLGIEVELQLLGQDGQRGSEGEAAAHACYRNRCSLRQLRFSAGRKPT